MGGADHLGPVVGGRSAEQIVGLALPEYLQVGVRFVEQHHVAGVEADERQQQQGLLHTPARGGEIQAGTGPIDVCEPDLASFGDEPRPVEPHPEKGGQAVGYLLPSFFPAGHFGHQITEVAQHLGRAALPQPDVDRSGFEPRLIGRQARYGAEQRHPRPEGLGNDRHAPLPARVGPQRPAVEALFVDVVELETALPRLRSRNPFYDHVDADVLGALPAAAAVDGADAQLPPQLARREARNTHQIPPVDRRPGPFGRRLISPLLRPAPQSEVPEGEGLQGGGLAGVVRADEHHRVAQLDVDFFEALEVADGEPGQHSRACVGRTGAESRPR